MNEKMFYSNCLLEAIKAKLKDWKHVKICHTSIKKNIELFDVHCPHYYWIKNGFRYDFHTDENLKFPKWLWWKGYIKITNLHKDKS